MTLPTSGAVAHPETIFNSRERVEQDAGVNPTQQILRAFELALQRSPDDAELASCQKLLADRRLAELCRVMLNLNEFAYVE